MFVGIPKKICLEGFSDFLDLLPEERSILRFKGKINRWARGTIPYSLVEGLTRVT